MSGLTPETRGDGLRRAVAIVAAANFAYFFVEFAVGRHIGSVALFADSVDFLEDTAVNFLVFCALAWSAARRVQVGRLLALLLLMPVAAALWTAVQQLRHPSPPDPQLLSITGGGALVVNVACAFLLAHHRDTGGTLSKAAFLSARNDALANIAIILTGLVTLRWPTGWPDLVVGIGIAAMNADAAREVWEAANRESGGQHRA